MRSYWKKVGPSSNMTCALISRPQYEDRDTQGECLMTTKAEIGVLEYAAVSQGIPKIASKLPKAWNRLSEGTIPADLLISNFHPPELQTKNFYVTQFVVLGYRSPS